MILYSSRIIATIAGGGRCIGDFLMSGKADEVCLSDITAIPVLDNDNYLLLGAIFAFMLPLL